MPTKARVEIYGRGQYTGYHRKPRYLYLLRAGGSQWYKIGIATHPDLRVELLQAGNPYRLLILGRWGPFGSELALQLEREMHGRANAAASGWAAGGREWFRWTRRPRALLKTLGLEDGS